MIRWNEKPVVGTTLRWGIKEDGKHTVFGAGPRWIREIDGEFTVEMTSELSGPERDFVGPFPNFESARLAAEMLR